MWDSKSAHVHNGHHQTNTTKCG